MTQVVSNRTGREKIITAEGENTEFSVEVKKQKNLLRVRSSIKLSKDHNFKWPFKKKPITSKRTTNWFR